MGLASNPLPSRRVSFIGKYGPRRFGDIIYRVLQIITVAFILFLVPAGGSNPAGQLLSLTYPIITTVII